MEIVIAFVVGAIAGFIGGFLVYRNNAEKLGKIEDNFKDS